MAQVNQETVDRIDRVLVYVAESAAIIADAHDRLGIPLSELIGAAVNRAASIHITDARQPELFGLSNGSKTQQKK